MNILIVNITRTELKLAAVILKFMKKFHNKKGKYETI